MRLTAETQFPYSFTRLLQDKKLCVHAMLCQCCVQAVFFRQKRDLAILPDDLYGKYMKDAPNPIFAHLVGSSWHGDDAKSVLWFIKHPTVICVVLAAGLVGLMTVAMQTFHRRRLPSVVLQNGTMNKMC